MSWLSTFLMKIVVIWWIFQHFYKYLLSFPYSVTFKYFDKTFEVFITFWQVFDVLSAIWRSLLPHMLIIWWIFVDNRRNTNLVIYHLNLFDIESLNRIIYHHIDSFMFPIQMLDNLLLLCFWFETVLLITKTTKTTKQQQQTYTFLNCDFNIFVLM